MPRKRPLQKEDGQCESTSSMCCDWLVDRLRSHPSTQLSARKFKPDNVIRQLRFRETGSRRCQMWKIFPSFVASNTRQLTFSHSARYKGTVFCTEPIISNRGHMFDVVLTRQFLAGPSLQLLGLNEGERIRELVNTAGIDPPQSFDCPDWVIGLTSKERLCVWCARQGVLLHQFKLNPLYNFRHLGWQGQCHTFYLSGNINRLLPEDVDNRKGRSAVLAVFDLFPLRCKGILELTREQFNDVVRADLDDDILICYCCSPPRTILYDFIAIWKEYTTRLFALLEYDGGETILPTNIVIPSHVKPAPILIVQGGMQDMLISGSRPPFTALSQPPASETGSLRFLIDKACHKFMPPSPNLLLHVQPVMFCPDGSGDVLCFENDSLTRYSVSQLPLNLELKKKHEFFSVDGRVLLKRHWSATLLHTSSQEVPHPDAATIVRTLGLRKMRMHQYVQSQVVVSSLLFDNISMLSLLMSYTADHIEPFQPTDDGGDCWLTVLMCIDIESGYILRVFPLEGTSVPDETFLHRGIERRDSRFVHSAEFSGHSVVEVYELKEKEQEEHVTDGERQKLKYESTRLSRKERRHLRRQANNSRSAEPS